MQLVGGVLRFSPSDVHDFLACEHLTWLEGQRVAGQIELRRIPRPDAELIAERGRRHEAAFHRRLQDEGREVVEIESTGTMGINAAADQTEVAMRRGAEVIFQAAFYFDRWQGYADFLIRTNTPSALGDWSYEAYDTKLAKHPKPYFIFQLAFYTEQIGRLQGRMPELMHVVLGSDEQQSFRYRDFSAYVSRVRQRFVDYVAAGAEPPYPYPIEHCAYCAWWRRCSDRRRADDNVSLVAHLGRSEAVKLAQVGVTTMRGLARVGEDLSVPRLAKGTFADLRLQAELQVYTEDTGTPVRRFLPLEEERGFFRMPAPSAGDVFFDIEGDPYWGDEGLEYLLGSVSFAADGATEYSGLWAHDALEERARFEEWVDWLTARLVVYPDLHIYHYNHYEPTTLKRLMSRYGTREDEVDELLRREVFVDLYTVVRQSMRIGQPSYSLKQLEVFYPLQRDADVTEAGGSILAYEEYLESGDQSKLDAIEEYNSDDCRSTLALRDWLLEQRGEAEKEFQAVLPNRDARPPTIRKPETELWLAELDQLLADLLESPGGSVDDSEARQLLADLLEYHRREGKPSWWAYFDRLEKSPQELTEEDTEAIGNLKLAEDIPRGVQARSFLYPMRFPPQQFKLDPPEAINPANEATVNLHFVDEAAGIAWIKRGNGRDGKPLPEALIPKRPIGEREQHDALRRLAARIIERGIDPSGKLDAACDLLARRAPRIQGVSAGTDLQTGRVKLEELQDQVAALESSVLFIQGPPGSGKTWSGARLAIDLMRRGRRVGVAATSHKAIHNFLDEIESVAAAHGFEFTGLKKSSAGNPESVYEGPHITSASQPAQFPPDDENIALIAGTSFLFAREEMRAAVDVLFVDEAGQCSLADALAMAQAARSVVLLGDPQQLAHVSQGTHPRGSGVSVLEHLLGERATVLPGNGIFLDRTWRMHPDVCKFISEGMYDGRLESVPGCSGRLVTSVAGPSGTGLRFLPVSHEDRRQTAPEEAEAIASAIGELSGGKFTDEEGETHDLTLEHILVVAPYNAQVRCLRDKLPDGARVGTVDKFQGQEAPVVFYSMTSSTAENVPRGLDFLFSRNRLNVAVSRAQCLAIIVASPLLLTARCSTVEQMRLINALCRFVDLAEAQSVVRGLQPADTVGPR